MIEILVQGPYCVYDFGEGQIGCVDPLENGTCATLFNKCPPKSRNTLELRKYIYPNILKYYEEKDIAKRNENYKKNVENVNTIEITDMSGLFFWPYKTDDNKYPFNEATDSLNFTATQKVNLMRILQNEFNMDISKWNTSMLQHERNV